MNSAWQLGLSLVLAAVAGVLNYAYLASQTDPTTYVAAGKRIKAGTVIEASDLQAVPIPGDDDRLKRSLIPHRSRSVLLGGKATRDYETGDMIFAMDLKPPAGNQRWDVIGPFELISVGERFREALRDPESIANSTRGNSVTIAVDANFDENTNRLLAAISPRSVQRDDEDPIKIVAVQVVPTDAANRGNQFLDPAIQRRDVVYQTVSLDGIANVPSVLLTGDRIRFVVPGN